MILANWLWYVALLLAAVEGYRHGEAYMIGWLIVAALMALVAQGRRYR